MPKIINMLKRNINTYYLGVNLISVSALSHRMRSIGSIMATIAVLSAVATTAIATGFTLYSNIEKNTYDTVGYDMYYYDEENNVIEDINQVFEKHDIKHIEKYSTDLYKSKPDIEVLKVNGYDYISDESYFRVYSESEYNQLVFLAKTELKQVDIYSGEALYIYPYMTEEIGQAISGYPLNYSKKTITITSSLRTSVVSFWAGHIIILDDQDFNALLQDSEIVHEEDENGNLTTVHIFNYEKALKLESLNSDLTRILSENTDAYNTAFSRYNDSLMVLMTASLLYFKQIMVAEEERHQYKMLRKIGMDDQVEKKVIEKRLLFIFFIPLIIGIIHSIFAMKAADTMVFSNMIPVENPYLTV